MVEIRNNALNTAIGGLQRAEADLDRAAHAVNTAAAVNANSVGTNAPAKVPGDQVQLSAVAAVTEAVRGAVVAPPAEPGSDGDLAKPLVDLIQAKVSYLANLQTVKVTSDVESDTTRLLSRLA